MSKNVDEADSEPLQILRLDSGTVTPEPPSNARRRDEKRPEVRIDIDDLVGGNLAGLQVLAASLRAPRRIRGARIVIMTKLNPQSVGDLLRYRGVLHDEVRRLEMK